eukprot:jgi/Antlo1/631/228
MLLQIMLCVVLQKVSSSHSDGEYVTISLSERPEMMLSIDEDGMAKIVETSETYFKPTDSTVCKLTPSEEGSLIRFNRGFLYQTLDNTTVIGRNYISGDSGFFFRMVPSGDGVMLMTRGRCLSVDRESLLSSGSYIVAKQCMGLQSQTFRIEPAKMESEEDLSPELRVSTHKTLAERDHFKQLGKYTGGYRSQYWSGPRFYRHYYYTLGEVIPDDRLLGTNNYLESGMEDFAIHERYGHPHFFDR